MIPPLSIHRSVAIACVKCHREANVIVEGQCVACHFGRHEAASVRRTKTKQRQGQH